jgi:hypothetical protein
LLLALHTSHDALDKMPRKEQRPCDDRNLAWSSDKGRFGFVFLTTSANWPKISSHSFFTT